MHFTSRARLRVDYRHTFTSGLRIAAGGISHTLTTGKSCNMATTWHVASISGAGNGKTARRQSAQASAASGAAIALCVCAQP